MGAWLYLCIVKHSKFPHRVFCLAGSYTPAPGGPFSALTPSMWPQDILAKYCQVVYSHFFLFVLRGMFYNIALISAR